MEGINVLFGIDCKNYLCFVKMLGKWELTKDAVDFFILIKLVNKGKKLLFSGAFGKSVHLGIVANLGAALLLISYINLGCGIITNDYNRKSRSYSVFIVKALDPLLFARFVL